MGVRVEFVGSSRPGVILRAWEGMQPGQALLWCGGCGRWRGRMVFGLRLVWVSGAELQVLGRFLDIVDEFCVCDLGSFARSVAEGLAAGGAVERVCVDVLRRAIAGSLRAQMLA